MKKTLCFLFICVLLFACGCAATPEAQHVTGWTLEDETRSEITDGVTYLQRTYMDEEDAPHRVYLLFLDPDKVTLKTGTSNNGFDLMPAHRQTVKEHARAAVNSGVNVLAAVNGDFFAIESTYMPTGLSVKDGVIIRLNSNNRPYCAVTKDGEYLISRGALDPVDVTTLDMAVGGSHVLVIDSQIQPHNPNDSFGTTPAPRTLSGEAPDGTIILAVIDGRQPGFSTGATLEQCAQLMHSLGAESAINHDGGGSSTFLLRSGKDFQVMNRPSDGSERKVFCSILVTEK